MNQFYITPIVKNLLILTGIVFVVSIFFPEFNQALSLFKTDPFNLRQPGIVEMLAREGFGQFKPYQVVTALFAHGGIFHIAFNLMFLMGIGTSMEMVIGPKRFLSLFLFCGVLGNVLIALFDPSLAPVVGSSVALSGVLVAFAYYFPNAEMSIFFLPITVKAKNYALGFALISGILVIANSDAGGISHFGHLAGMAAGAIYFILEPIFNRFNR